MSAITEETSSDLDSELVSEEKQSNVSASDPSVSDSASDSNSDDDSGVDEKEEIYAPPPSTKSQKRGQVWGKMKE